MADATKENAASETSYVFDNAAQETHCRFEALPALYDAGTIRHLGERGAEPGWQCLEVGAGSGSIAAWLAERVAFSGSVLATDINPRFMQSLRHPCLEVLQHDVTTDPLPSAAYHLIHARLVLSHLPARDRVLGRLAATLRPGGWIVIEEFDTASVSHGPTLDSTPIPFRTLEAMRAVLATNGVDLEYGRRVPALLREQGLIEIGSESRSFLWTGASIGARLMQANFEQLRAAILASGVVSEREFAADHARLNDRGIGFPSPTMWATWGRRPIRGNGVL